ncbi:related to MCM10 - essential chromatin-associated protein involved in the initiation of DNA replication [Melanopsichium pennsylvanicum]|uniref:Related to MCM10 - essential chromatin-associated protein involved in the initiation of DNA replication n=2 Tax=Melanopsichium pennsylvanicum TaxID=63383 RepID=A0AAJ5C4A2_9BASI|nr:zf-primase-domain-containing partial [Melanopsichium pennsylvanicum 4]SNX83475.1 related to MCM10 - essential chromatin-associated protein involved in the initiation of DNA replication [Melanopsichium pennsylvanicum]
MEVTRTATTSKCPAAHLTTHTNTILKPSLPPLKRQKPVVAPSSPSKPKPKHQRLSGHARILQKDQEARRKSSLISYAEARARASTTYEPPPRSDHHHYPPGYSDDLQADNSARALLQQIKNRIHTRAPPNSSNFLQKAKQVQQSLFEKQQKAAQVRRLREHAARRESFRSAGFGEQYAVSQHVIALDKSFSQAKIKPIASQGAFARAKQRSCASDAQDSDDVVVEDDDNDADHDYVAAYSVSRDEDLALTYNLQPGPRPIPANPDDPKWEHMEPYSGHRLRERKLPHSQLKDHLRGRYHISPSLLYSVARPMTIATLSDRQMDSKAYLNGDYQVPVDGDWIVIATIVEKSDLLITKGFKNHAFQNQDSSTKTSPCGDDNNEHDPVLFKDVATDGKLILDLEQGNSDAFSTQTCKNSKRRAPMTEIDEEMERKREEARLNQRPRKFVILKLVDLGVDSTDGDATGSAGRGDNYLSLIAYESDQVDTSLVHSNKNIRSDVSSILASHANKKYVNGSRGAFELLYKQAEGTIVAIMNPRVLRPFPSRPGDGKSGARPGGFESKMLRITPRSAEDCLVIGQAADYRRCSAIKSNGQRCSSFVDIKARKQTRTTTCDFHLSRHMDQLARGRPEFAANSTSRFGGAGGGGSSGGNGNASFSNRRVGGGYNDQDSIINNITTSYKTAASSEASRLALAKKLNSSYASVGDGMENNGGNVYVSQSPLVCSFSPDQDNEVRASDPSSWKYDVSNRYGRGNTEKQARLRKQIEEEKLLREIEARFAPNSSKKKNYETDDDDENDGEATMEGEDAERCEHKKKNKRGGKEKEHVLPILPNGTADMINAAYNTLEQRKRAAREKQEAVQAKRRKYTGVVVPSSSRVSEMDVETKLRFMSNPGSKRSSNTLLAGLPIAGLNRHTVESDNGKYKKSGDSRSKLLSLAQGGASAFTSVNGTVSVSAAVEPSLKMKKAHRPKMRLPIQEVGQLSKLKVIGGELVNLEDFQDDDWEDDLDDLVRKSAEVREGIDQQEMKIGLSDRIIQFQSQRLQPRQNIIEQTNTDSDSHSHSHSHSDSDLEII